MGRSQALAVSERNQSTTTEGRAVPHEYRHIKIDARVSVDGAVQWGWAQWQQIAPKIHRHTKKHGRTGLTAVLIEGQKAFPAHLHRGKTTLSACCAPTASIDIPKLAAWIVENPELVPRLELVEPPLDLSQAIALADFARLYGIKSQSVIYAEIKAKRLQVVKTGRLVKVTPEALARFEKLTGRKRLETPLPPRVRASAAVLDEAPQTPQPSPMPVQHAQPQQSAEQVLSGFLAMPIGALLPSLKALFSEALREALATHHETIARAVRETVTEVVGAPVVQPTTTETSTKSETTTLETQGSHAMSTTIAPAARDEPAHDLETQLSIAASALGIETQRKREAILIVGVHPRVEQEVERHFGSAFRFYFKRPDAFNSSNDIPASADGVLIARKPHLPSEITAFFRRVNMPNDKISNDTNSVLWALKRLFPESTERLRPIQ